MMMLMSDIVGRNNHTTLHILFSKFTAMFRWGSYALSDVSTWESEL